MMSTDTRVSEAQGAQDTQFEGLEFVETDSFRILNSVLLTLVGILDSVRCMHKELKNMSSVSTVQVRHLCMGVQSLVSLVLDNDLAALRGELVRDLMKRDEIVGTARAIDDLLTSVELLAENGIEDFRLKRMTVMNIQVQSGYFKDMMRRLLR